MVMLHIFGYVIITSAPRSQRTSYSQNSKINCPSYYTYCIVVLPTNIQFDRRSRNEPEFSVSRSFLARFLSELRSKGLP
jgi:hypothetical protein